jgi:hypothetical protein
MCVHNKQKTHDNNATEKAWKFCLNGISNSVIYDQLLKEVVNHFTERKKDYIYNPK